MSVANIKERKLGTAINHRLYADQYTALDKIIEKMKDDIFKKTGVQVKLSYQDIIRQATDNFIAVHTK